MIVKKKWWKESVVYQIYPRSFCDSNGDGIGDLRGIISRLDYLEALGVDVVWLSPVYQSPNDDNGYDISDYREIMPEFGTMADFEEMLAAMHERGIRLMMDLVVNHTSDEHRWFVEACKSKDNPYRDYYIWRPPKPDGSEPNNWASRFHGSAWEFQQSTGEYFLHLYSRKQPDLNWENPNVRAEVHDLMRFWLDKGVDGFRMDVINSISKVPGLPDTKPINADRYQYGREQYLNGPKLLDYLAEIKEEVLSKYDIITVGETPAMTPEYGVRLTNETDGALNMLFQFEHMDIDREGGAQSTRWTLRKWAVADLRATMGRWQLALHGRGWNSLYLANHDQPRPVSRFGDDREYRVVSAKMLATFLHLHEGTPYIYQGEELGMTNVAFSSIDDYRDIDTLNIYRDFTQRQGLSPEQALAMIHIKSRDNARTPMQWDEGANAGFTTGTPWIKVNPNHIDINARQALADPDSVFHYYRKLIELRRSHPIIVYGRFDAVLEGVGDSIYAFTRTLGDECWLVVCNFSGSAQTLSLPENLCLAGAMRVFGNYTEDAAQPVSAVALRPYEASVYRLGWRHEPAAPPG